MYYKIQNNEIVARGLPSAYTHEDGSVTVGYDLLPQEELYEQGWREVIEMKADYDPSTHHLEQREHVKLNNEGFEYVVVEYIAVENDLNNVLQPSTPEIEKAEFVIKVAEALTELGVL
jgi:hypothetical protein